MVVITLTTIGLGDFYPTTFAGESFHFFFCVTGLGIVSCLGSELRAVERRLREGPPGTVFVPEYAARGLRSQVAALPEVAALFKQGVTDEVLCVLDTLVYGCAGGSQPACKGSSGSADGG